MRSEAPELDAHTATGGPGGTRKIVEMPNLDVRSEILWRDPSARGGHAMNSVHRPLETGDCGAAAEADKSREALAPTLLNFDLRARLFELLLDARGFVLADTFLDGLGSPVNEVLGFLQAEARDFANGLNDVDLVAAHIGKHDGEFRLLFRGSCSGACSRATASRHHRGCRGGNAEGFFHLL